MMQVLGYVYRFSIPFFFPKIWLKECLKTNADGLVLEKYLLVKAACNAAGISKIHVNHNLLGDPKPELDQAPTTPGFYNNCIDKSGVRRSNELKVCTSQAWCRGFGCTDEMKPRDPGNVENVQKWKDYTRDTGHFGGNEEKREIGQGDKLL